ncbi:XapX domain-containing protein [Dyella silvatica]|uniref:XapX domain-containing protein n=1 Tax=Dyella silvatica TaxID=2992128 RepID=UPI00225A2B7E|nr:XapX domain-containing protein [Dyella silvatica]
MKPYVLSLAAGLLVGIVYSFLKVRSPAPPLIALIGLLGILVGEQLPPLVRHLLNRDAVETTALGDQVKPHALDHLSQGQDAAHPATDTEAKS